MRTRSRLNLGICLALVTSLFIALPAHAEVIRMDEDGLCPASHPIKGQISDARTGVTYYECKTQYDWDIEMMGGDAYQRWIDSGKTLDMTADIAYWKAEKSLIEQKRIAAEAAAKAEADANPGVQICKSWSYESIYNGSGGGSICTITPNPADGFTDDEFNSLFTSIRTGFENDPQYAQLRRQIVDVRAGTSVIEIYTPQERAEALDAWATWTAATQLAREKAKAAAQLTPGKQRCVFWSRNGQNGQECAQTDAVVETPPNTDDGLLNSMLIKPRTMVATSGQISVSTAKYLSKLDKAIPTKTKKSTITLPKLAKRTSIKAVVTSGSCTVVKNKVRLAKGSCELEFTLTTASGTARLVQSITKS